MTERQKPVLTHDIVSRLIQKAVEKAEEMDLRMSVAVVDDGGNLSGFLRMQGARLIPARIAQNKAYTAVGFGRATSTWHTRMEEQPDVWHGIASTDGVALLGGGLPIEIQGILVGGIGVSGGSVDQDEECAKWAIKEGM